MAAPIQVKASAFFSLQIFFSSYEKQQLILGTGTAIWWVTEPHYKYCLFIVIMHSVFIFSVHMHSVIVILGVVVLIVFVLSVVAPIKYIPCKMLYLLCCNLQICRIS